MSAAWVRGAAELSRLAASLAGSRALALDSESDSLYHFNERVCLLQLATEAGEAVLVDTLALDDLGPLAPLIEDAGVVKVLHGADYDVATLGRDFGFRFRNLFDTMIAARFLGMPEVGLQAVARAELGVELSKDSQRDDWSRRPLTARQEAYAAADVRYLLTLHERLSARLRERGRLEWVREECDAVAELEPARRDKDPEAWAKLKGVSRLGARQQAVVRELFAWRESAARSADVPPFRIVNNEALMAIAEKMPRNVAELAQVPGTGPRLRAEGDSILAAVARAMALSDPELPRLVRPERPVVSWETRRRIDALRAWRTEHAARIGLDVSLVLPQRLLEKVAAAAPATVDGLGRVPGLRRWRVEVFGQAMLDALRLR